jgi:hypothetical protein
MRNRQQMRLSRPISETVRFNGLELLTNVGTLTMGDGEAGDRLILSGNYNGRGNTRSNADAFLGAARFDG